MFTTEATSGDCAAAYMVSSADLDTSSPSGLATTLGAFALASEANTFRIDGLYYYPAGDVTVEAHLEGANVAALTSNAFTVEVPFEVYDGNQIISVVNDIPGEDDDGDGVIDNPEESEPDDEIDANAFLVCKGTLLLSVVRGGQVSTTQLSPPVVFEGIFNSADSLDSFRGQALVNPDGTKVVLLIRDVLAPGGVAQIPSLVDLDGAFGSQLTVAGTEVVVRGSLNDGVLVECSMLVTSRTASRLYKFQPRTQ